MGHRAWGMWGKLVPRGQLPPKGMWSPAGAQGSAAPPGSLRFLKPQCHLLGEPLGQAGLSAVPAR